MSHLLKLPKKYRPLLPRYSFILLALYILAPPTYATTQFKPFDQSISSTAPYSTIDLKIQLGDMVADFELLDSRGNVYKLSDFRDKQHVLLIFYRGSWCPYCVSHFDDIQNLFPTLDKHNVQLLAISPDTQEKSTKLAQRFNKPYIFLSDPSLETAEKYGVRRDKKLPHPAIFLIDKSGKLAWYHIDQKYWKRASGTQLKQIIGALTANN